jgi:hypothetical protein
MAVRLDDAKIKVTLETQVAKEQLDRLSAEVKRVAERRQEIDVQKGQKEEEQRKEDQDDETAKQAAKGMRFNRQMLTAAGLVGAIPFIGPAAKLSTELTQKFGPFAAGGLAGIEMMEKLVTNINKLDARLKAIEPAFDKTLSVAKAQMLMAGKEGLNVPDLMELFTNLYEMETIQRRLKFKVDMEVKEIFGKAAGGAMTEAIMRAATTGSISQ